MAGVSTFPGCGCSCYRTSSYTIRGRELRPYSVHSTNLRLSDMLLVKWSSNVENLKPDIPTVVLLHGSFARRLAQEFPMWIWKYSVINLLLSMIKKFKIVLLSPSMQFLLVDFRCHGDSTSIMKRGPNTVASDALDILKLVAQLRVTPQILVGHSFGGEVALSMVEQAAKPLARSVKVWVLDATPGKLRPGGDGEDLPGELIAFLSTLAKQVLISLLTLDVSYRVNKNDFLTNLGKDISLLHVTHVKKTILTAIQNKIRGLTKLDN
ncbi:hypothetical protein MKW94_025164 [Papaver nudicaule]|uniref:AB hydrolase-1 domain-containing protein n=1 Tax=Papaver nudicaule TaxID=74823 RepID=A0AA41SDA5_PAPNU|nr:hypothetical protein [Papaver nudicaule]